MTDLISSIDAFAADILERARGDGSVKNAKKPSLAECIQALAAVSKWVELKSRLQTQAPSQPEESPFDKLKSRLTHRGNAKHRAPAGPIEATGGEIDDGAAPLSS